MATTSLVTTTTTAPLSASRPPQASLKDTLSYLEDQFLPAVNSSASSFNDAAARTPLQSKAVGAVDLEQQRQQQKSSTTAILENVQDTLFQLSQVLTHQMDELFVQQQPSAIATTMQHSMAIRLIEALARSLEGILSVSSSRQTKLSAFRVLLTFCNRFVETLNQGNLGHTSDARLALASTVCRVFRHLEKVPSQPSVTHTEFHLYRDCFCSSLHYLSQFILILHALPVYKGGDNNTSQAFNHEGQQMVTGLYNVLEDLKLVECILFQQRHVDRIHEVMPTESKCVLEFLSLLATCEDAKMLSLLVFDEIGSLLNEVLRAGALSSSRSQPVDHTNPHTHTIRGYRPMEHKPSRNKRSNRGGILKTTSMTRTGWEEDPKHNNVIAVYEFLVVLLQAAETTFSSTGDRKVQKRCYEKALYCLDRNQQTVQACLQQVSHATLTDGSQGLTIQILREASAILALVTELCNTRQGMDLFRQKYAQLYQDLIKDAHGVMLSLCCFLGAAGISRELFCQMDDTNTGGGGPANNNGVVMPRGLGFSPIIDVFLSSGRSNTRHESIQFSHFVSAASAAVSVTEREHQSEYPKAWATAASLATGASSTRASGSPSGQQPQSPALTESSLEQNSRRAMTTKFEFTLEMEAAKCLFNVCSAHWVNHPSSTSYVEFTPVELSKLRHDISWIKAGDVIGYFKDAYDRSSVMLGEVELVDTINLCCIVRPMNNKENHQTVIVPQHQLAGVEDRAKRHSVLAFSHAPETSSDLHKSRAGLSVGHLVLAMRWCHEYSFEQEQQGTTQSREWIRMNAEVLSLLLAKEISLQRESGHSHRVPPNVTSMLNAQLLDVFGDQVEFSSFLYGYPSDVMRQQGRLQDLISTATWNAIREKLRGELDDALAHVKAVQEKEMARQQNRRMY